MGYDHTAEHGKKFPYSFELFVLSSAVSDICSRVKCLIFSMLFMPP